tara:strand:+ start:550 stop:738 length:189 start_codon:yes stop_codon:yes gene_type:complete
MRRSAALRSTSLTYRCRSTIKTVTHHQQPFVVKLVYLALQQRSSAQRKPLQRIAQPSFWVSD